MPRKLPQYFARRIRVALVALPLRYVDSDTSHRSLTVELNRAAVDFQIDIASILMAASRRISNAVAVERALRFSTLNIFQWVVWNELYSTDAARRRTAVRGRARRTICRRLFEQGLYR